MSGYLAKTRRMSAGNVPDMGIALVLSALLHLVGASLAYWWHSSPPELYGRAQDLEIDVSFIPLSSLATNIPPSAPPTEKKDLSPQPEPIPAEPAPRRDPPPENVVSLAPRRKEEAPAPKVNKLPQQQDQMPVKPLAHYESRARLGSPTGTGDPNEQARISYQDLIATRIAKAKRYPEGALRRHTTGSGVVRVTIVSSGQVDGFELVQSTDSPILDEELQDMVERASPFPPFPEDLKRDSIAIVLPVAFQLNP
jgi:protein TonB